MVLSPAIVSTLSSGQTNSPIPFEFSVQLLIEWVIAELNRIVVLFEIVSLDPPERNTRM